MTPSQSLSRPSQGSIGFFVVGSSIGGVSPTHVSDPPVRHCMVPGRQVPTLEPHGVLESIVSSSTTPLQSSSTLLQTSCASFGCNTNGATVPLHIPLRMPVSGKL